MKNIVKGSVEGVDVHRGWFIGHFLNDPFKTDAVEVKWGVHKKGELRPQVAANKTAKTVSVLVKGKFVFRFPVEKKEVVLEQPGEYVFWNNGVYHTFEALEDSVVVTVRWPSVENDQVILN
ncbi:signal peptidase I [Candidatus Woesearchaeota archaeon]|nr:signal peptidase I [Candidatus Woesearchaeota archaeon]